MNYLTINAIKDTQVLLKEVQLYPGVIDGVWGGNTSMGLFNLVQDYAIRNFGDNGLIKPFSKLSGDAGTAQGLKDVQSALKAVKLYNGAIDGIIGQGSLGSLEVVSEGYRASHRLVSYDIAWSLAVPPEFIAKVKAWVKKMALNPRAASWLMSCMAFESGGTFSPSIQNAAGSQAYGLIQFMTGAAGDLGTTLDALRSMSQLDQLDYVFKYFEFWQRAGKQYTQLEDFYLTIFYPKAVGMKPDEKLFAAGTKSYVQNKGFDVDKDGYISIGEISSTIRNKYYQGMLPEKRVRLLTA